MNRRLAACAIVAVLLAAPAWGSAAPGGSALAEFAAARLAQAEGDFTRALAGYERAVALDPEAVDLRIEYALAWLAAAEQPAGDRAAGTARAIEQAEAAVRLAPGNAEALRALAQVKLEAAADDPALRGEAREALEALVVLRPSDAGAGLALGRMLLEDGEAGRAAEVLRGLLRRVPGQRGAARLLVEAVGRAAGDDPARQRAALERELAADAGLLIARLGLAEADREAGDPWAALTRLEAAPAEQREDPEWLYQRGLTRFRALDFEGALADLERAGEDVPERERRFLIADVLSADGRFAAAAEALEPWVLERPDDLEAAVGLARIEVLAGSVSRGVARLVTAASAATGAGRPGQALALRLRAALLAADAGAWDEVERALEGAGPPAAPADPVAAAARAQEVTVLRAEALRQAGRSEEAMARLAAGPAGPVVDAKRAELLIAAGERRAGRRLLEELARGEPAKALVAGEAWQRLGDHRRAIRAFDRVLAAEPRSLEAAFRRASSVERLGRRAESVAAFRRLLAAAPTFSPAANYLAYTLAEAGESLEEALRWARRATALEPASGAYADTLGWTLHRLGAPGARRELERAARLLPADGTVAAHLAEALEAEGDFERALREYRRATGLGIDDRALAERARRRLAALSARAGGAD